jgi:hypothetical protein
MKGKMRNSKRRMPERYDFGRGGNTLIGMAMLNAKEYANGGSLFKSADRVVMGYQLPSWQRGFVWTGDQMSKLIESIWLGIPIGTWSFNRNYDRPDLDDLLIDGQQRLYAIERYLDDAFPVFGFKWSEVTRVDRRVFEGTVFPSYITETDDEGYLRNYYNMMNFGGVAHKENERA